ncbi:MAG: tetratricopeptide repeat protein [Fibrobacteres bacterium]|nr:tetratricopeptide repeat protein [Fibrobacterota bacterium]
MRHTGSGLLILSAAAILTFAWPALSAGIPEADASGNSDVTGAKPFRAFNDTVYALAYDVFLAARNVKDAFELAKEAVRQRPELSAWRERLAKTAEWAGDPALALREWEYLGAHGRRGEAYREAVRLAAALRDYNASVRAWEGIAAEQDLDAAEWSQFLDAYENSGEPGKGIERLRKRLAGRPDSVLTLKLIELLERTDRDAEALKTLETMASQYGNSPAIGLRRAEIYSRRGRIREAAAVLDAVHGLATGEAERIPILRLQASAYVWMQRYGDALKAYRALFESGRYDAADLRDLNGLARLRDPDLAMRAAVAGWAKFREPDMLVYYLERCIEVDRWDLASRALAGLTPDQWALFTDAPYFYVLAARIHQKEGKPALARREFQRALSQEPGSEDFQSGYLWLLIEQSRLSDLAVYADRWNRGPATPQSLLEPLAMANKLLQRHREALAYFRLLDREGEHPDFPFLLSYAEILEEAGDGQGALRAYRRAGEAMRAPPAPGDDRQGREWLEAEARWAWKFGSSDETAGRMAALNRQFKGGSGSKEAAFSWRVDRGENPEDAMAALGGAGTGEKDFPAWAQLAVAMRTENVGKVADLLDNKEAGLGAEDKARAAAFLGNARAAAGYAGEGGMGLASIPEPTGIRALRGAAGIGGGYEADRHLFYDEEKAVLQGDRPMGAGVLLSAHAETRRRPWISKDLDVTVPDREDAGNLELKRVTRHGTTRLAAGIRSTSAAAVGGSRDPLYSVTAEQDWRPMREVSIIAGYDRNALAEENPILAIAAVKECWRGGLHLSLPAEVDLDLHLARAGFRSWDRRWLGEGALARVVVEHRLLPSLSAGTSFAYNGFASAQAMPGPKGISLIGGLLTPKEFPQTFWHGSAYLEWQDRTRPEAGWLPSPTASFELGRNYFPDPGSEGPGAWANELAVRAGFTLKPSAAQRITALAEYASGLLTRNESESALSLNYACTFR